MSNGKRDSLAMFDELRGRPLSSVTFVHDYVQLGFDGLGIKVTNPWTVRTGDINVTSCSPGFRDALCAQIGKIVSSVEIRNADAFIITFDDRSLLSVSLRDADYRSPEALHAFGFLGNAIFVV